MAVHPSQGSLARQEAPAGWRPRAEEPEKGRPETTNPQCGWGGAQGPNGDHAADELRERRGQITGVPQPSRPWTTDGYTEEAEAGVAGERSTRQTLGLSGGRPPGGAQGHVGQSTFLGSVMRVGRRGVGSEVPTGHPLELAGRPWVPWACS